VPVTMIRTRWKQALCTLHRGFLVGLPVAAITGVAYGLFLGLFLFLEAAGLNSVLTGLFVTGLGTIAWLYAIGHVAAPRDYEIPRPTGIHSLKDLRKLVS
jgi:hypothetical protein